MVITYHGQNNFRLTSGATTLAVDPLNDRLKPTLAIKTLIDPSNIPNDFGIVSTAGEFDLADIEVRGVQLDNESTSKFIKNVYLVKGLDDLRLAFLGHASNNIDKEVVETIGVVDILFISIGEHYLKTEDAEKIIKEIAPKMVVVATFGDISAKTLSKDFGKDIKSENKITIKAKDLPEKGFDVIVLEKS